MYKMLGVCQSGAKVGSLLIASLLVVPSSFAAIAAIPLSAQAGSPRAAKSSAAQTATLDASTPNGNSGGLGTIDDVYQSQSDPSSPPPPVADSFGQNGEANPGAPWGIDAAASGGAGSSDTLFTDGSGHVFEGPTSGPGPGVTLQPVVPRSQGTGPFVADMSLDPSGTLVAYVDSNGNIDVADALTGNNVVPLGVSGDDPQWSPNGVWIAYEDAGGGLDIVKPDGTGGQKTLSTESADGVPVRSPSWFPNSQALAAVLEAPGNKVDACGRGISPGTDVAILNIANPAPQFLGVGYFNDLGQDTDPIGQNGPCWTGFEWDAFNPQSVAVSPDGTSLAVDGQNSNCTQVGDSGYVTCANGEGEDGFSPTHQDELGIVPASGGPFSGASIVKKLGVACLFLAPCPGESPSYSEWGEGFGVGWDLYWVGQAAPKITFYVQSPKYQYTEPNPVYGNVGHSWVQFRDGQDAGPCSSDPSCVTLGLVPKDPIDLLYGPGKVTPHDDWNWSWRITFHVTPAAYNAAQSFAVGEETATKNGSLPQFSGLNVPGTPSGGQNCIGFDLWVAQLAGITVPNPQQSVLDYSSLGLGGIGSFPTSIQFAQALADIGDGNDFDGGLVQSNQITKTTAGDATDPPQPYPAMDSPIDIATAALQDPSGTAAGLDLRHDSTTLAPITAGTGTAVNFAENDATLPSGAVYALDPGDSTSPVLGVLPPLTSTPTTPQLSHQYSEPGTYNYRLIVVQAASLEEYDGTVTVTDGGPQADFQQFNVPPPPPPPYADYPSNQGFDPAHFLGSPSLPSSVQGIPGDGTVTVNWGVPYSPPETDPITSYTVTASPGDATQTLGGSSTTAVFGGLTNGTAYTFSVAATNDVGTGFAATVVATPAPLGFQISPAALPAATVSVGYGPVTLQTSGQVAGAALKWKKLLLPKGLKLSSAGVLSGIPNRKLVPGGYSVVIQVTETVITLNGRKKVKTPTTVRATIPLTVT